MFYLKQEKMHSVYEWKTENLKGEKGAIGHCELEWKPTYQIEQGVKTIV